MARILISILAVFATLAEGMPSFYPKRVRAARDRAELIAKERPLQDRGATKPAPKSPCAPADIKLDALRLTSRSLAQSFLGNGTAGTWTGPKFYLHEAGAFNFADRVKCFFNALGTDMYHANMDMLVLPNVAEHTTDVWVLQSLRGHPGRVRDASLADLHIIGAAVGTSFHATHLPGSPCGTLEDHQTRVKALLEELKSSWAFRQSGGRSWMLINTDWDWNIHVLTPEFAALVQSEHMLLATVDRDISAFGKVEPSDTIVLPYKAHGSLDIGHELLALLKLPADRKFSFTFHGNMDRDDEGAWRSILRNITWGLDAISVEDVSFYDEDPQKFGAVTGRTAKIMQESKFCLVPAGDTASSRRLFDALAAGCVPIILDDFESALVNLPFTHSIDWTKLAYFAGALPCVAHKVYPAKDWLRALWDGKGDADVTEKQSLGRQTFLDTLSYRGGKLASAMLAEVSLVRPFHGM